MQTNLDTLIVALYVQVDDLFHLLGVRRGPGRPPRLSDSELACLAVAQVLRPLSEKAGTEYPDVPAPTKIDELIVAKLRKLGIVPAEICSDAEFLRRISLDMTGTLPTPRELA